MKRPVQRIFFIFLAVALFLAGYLYYLHNKRYPSTDDAYVQAHVVNIAPQVSGEIQSVQVHNQQTVLKNDLLFTIDPAPFEIAVQKANADLTNAQQSMRASESAVQTAAATLQQRKAEFINVQKDYDRVQSLVAQNFYSKSAGDKATRDLEVTKQAVIAAQNQLNQAQAALGKSGDENATIKAAQAALAAAQLNLQYTKVYAPESGEIARMTLRAGQAVTAYEPLFSLVENKEWWVTANMKETNLSRVHPGQRAIVRVDMYAAHPFRGIVESISPGSGESFALLPPENASGNWVKVMQRFPVRIKLININKTLPFRIGASCHVTIDTKSRKS